MARFNKTNPVKSTKTVNRAGGEAYKQSDKLALVSLLLTSMLKDQFYRSGSEQLRNLQTLLNNIDPLFAAKAAVFARNEYGMRSITHVTAAVIAEKVKGEEWTKRFFQKIVRRPDDMFEILALVQKPVPNSIKKGFARVLEGYGDHQLAKYKGNGKDVSMVDVVNLCHPRATESLTKLIKGTLKPADTWETQLTQAGQKAENAEDLRSLKRDAWKDLIDGEKLGTMALLRNLRNIMTQAPDCVDAACKQLVNAEKIRKSLVLPFRFATAYEEISKVNDVSTSIKNKVLEAIEKALEVSSVANVPKFDGETLVALDVSGSMQGKPIEIGSLFSVILAKSNDADFLTFDTRSRFQSLDPNTGFITCQQNIIRNAHGGGTDFRCIFNGLTKKYDRIIILSDMQGWVGGTTPRLQFEAYKKKFGANPHIYSFDLQGYGDMQFPENQVYCIAGFSDKIFDTMKVLEQDRNALIHRIETVEI